MVALPVAAQPVVPLPVVAQTKEPLDLEPAPGPLDLISSI